MNWTQIIKDVLSTSILSGIAVFFIQQLGKHFIDKNFKAYELELKYKSDEYKHQLDKSLENHRAELNILFSKTSKLHEHRLKIIEELYKKLVRLDQAMVVMTVLWKAITGNEKIDEEAENGRIMKAVDSYNEFMSFYIENTIFFSDSVCILLEELRKNYHQSYWDYTAQKRWGFTDIKLNMKNAKNASDKVVEEVPKIKKEIENEFRHLIGVEMLKKS